MQKKSLIQNELLAQHTAIALASEPLVPNAAHAVKIASFFISDGFNYINETSDYLAHLRDCLMTSDLFESKDDRESFLFLEFTIRELAGIDKSMSLKKRQKFASWALDNSLRKEAKNG